SREDVATKKRGPFQEDDNSSPDFSHLQQQGRVDFTQFLPCRLTVLIKLPPGLEDPFNFFTFIPLLQSSREDVATKKRGPFQEDDNSSPDFSHLQQQSFLSLFFPKFPFFLFFEFVFSCLCIF
ncbi:unnamed protein product, partial [Darwinula stevensoni]